MTRVSPYLAPVLLAVLLSCAVRAADYVGGVGAAGRAGQRLSGAEPAGRGIVTDTGGTSSRATRRVKPSA